MYCKSFVVRRRLTLSLGLVFVCLGLASGQYYGGGYPYPTHTPEPARPLPSPARSFGGFQGNPYRNSTIPPTGMPIGSTHSYFGAGTVGGNPMAHRPAQKPFSNVNATWGPLVTSHQAAQIEVARGLWWGG